MLHPAAYWYDWPRTQQAEKGDLPVADVKRIYGFGDDADGVNRTEGGRDLKFVLGGKGANLAEMANLGLPVPPGFTITCQTCAEYYDAGGKFPDGLVDDIHAYTADLEAKMGKRLGDADDPLLVSVRSGAAFSMPGMMDTILNLGLNDESVQGLIAQTGNERFAWDSYRRFVQMFSKVVLDLEGDLFENAITSMKQARGVRNDTDLSASDLKDLVAQFKDIVGDHASAASFPQLVNGDGRVAFPLDIGRQLFLAIEAVFKSWMNDRAILYRKLHRIDSALGTAVNVQSMVFGNKGDSSATGVAFTRDPASGANDFYGDFLTNAQGEDVVAGIRNTEPIARLKSVLPEAGAQLEDVFRLLEGHYRDMCDIEFTIEQGKLWMLQTRVGKRTARAALKIAVDMVDEGLITREEAIMRIDADQLDQLLHPQFDPKADYDVVAKGLNASPGAAVGEVVFTANDADAAAAEGRKVVLVRWETTPDDLHGMVAAQGILTSHGGKTSHAAVVARGMGKPCVCGVDALRIDAEHKVVRIASTDIVIAEGDIISIDGTSGIVVLGAVDLVMPEVSGEFDTVLKWSDEFRTMGVRANADTPDDATLSRSFGAAGIGLCRTEHMFLGDRKHIVQDMIIAETPEEREAPLAKLLDVQTRDYLGIFEAMDGLPVTVRLLDPPLHEFLDNPRELDIEITKLECRGGDPAVIAEKKKLLALVDSMAEMNPMLGLRGCRLGIVFPEIYGMQVRAITLAACQLRKQGKDPRPEIMIPLVSVVTELETLRAESEKIVAEVQAEQDCVFEMPIGTMIELPRAAITADEIATVADFFSFGTNDLTQTTFGFSRDDIESKFLPCYLERKILERNPFETVDPGVAELVRIACEKGRQTNPKIKLGVCGEHGGDPDSVKIFHTFGLTYVSCSPYRVPLARLAAAQAALAETAAASDNR
jgi:pyruvate,orthophosphate dikinase